MMNLLQDLLCNVDQLQIEVRSTGRHCRYCTHRMNDVGQTVQCEIEERAPELCPEVERQLRAVKFHLDCVVNLTEPSANDWVRRDDT